MAWGMMLVDLAKHIAAAIHHSTGKNQEEALRQIRAGFDAEWGYPTDTPSGKLSHRGGTN